MLKSFHWNRIIYISVYYNKEFIFYFLETEKQFKLIWFVMKWSFLSPTLTFHFDNRKWYLTDNFSRSSTLWTQYLFNLLISDFQEIMTVTD